MCSWVSGKIHEEVPVVSEAVCDGRGGAKEGTCAPVSAQGSVQRVWMKLNCALLQPVHPFVNF